MFLIVRDFPCYRATMEKTRYSTKGTVVNEYMNRLREYNNRLAKKKTSKQHEEKNG